MNQLGSPGMQRQRGVALAVGLIILLLPTVLGISAMRGSIFELQMARNEEARLSAFERAQSIIDACDRATPPTSRAGEPRRNQLQRRMSARLRSPPM